MKFLVEVKQDLFHKGLFILGKENQAKAKMFCINNSGKIYQVEIKELKQ